MKMGRHAELLLQAVGEPAADSNNPLLSDFDWAGHGVSHPYIIFMTGRCGSTLLTSILQETGLVGNPREFFNEQVARYESDGAQGLHGYLSTLTQKETSCGRFGIEIDSTRLRDIEGLIDWSSVFPSPSTRTLFLYRSSLPAQAWSWVSARKSGLWHARAHGKHSGPSVSEALPTEHELVQEIIRIRRDEEYLQRFFGRYGYQPYYIDYESLLTDIDTETRTILRILSVDCDNISNEQITADNKAVAKIRYVEKNRALAEFNSKHANALSVLRKNRFHISVGELADLFA